MKATVEPEASRAMLALPQAILHQGRRSIGIRWILSRALTLGWMSFLHEGDVSGDVVYYSRTLRPLFAGASTRYTLQEYPLGVLGLMAPQFLIAASNQIAFTLLFALSMLSLDAAFTALLWRADGRKRGDATNFWLWFVPLVGPLSFFRFDLVPAVLAGAAVLAAVRRPRIAGVLTAVGAAIKLWPVAMLPTLLIRRDDRRPALVGFLGAGLLIGALVLAIAGPARNLSPLYWQSSRGLQIESVPASPLMAGRMFSHHTWNLGISQYKSWEIFGPAVSALITASTVTTALGAVLLCLFWWRALHAPLVTGETLGWIFLCTTLIVTVTNKALSPQYLLWLGGPLAALAVRAPANHEVRVFARVLLIAALLTQLVYPIGYQHLTGTQSQLPVWTTVLLARNLLLLWLTYYSARRVWIRTGAVKVPATAAVAA